MTEMVDSATNANAHGDMKALVFEIAKALVDNTGAVEVDVFEDEGATVLQLRVAPEDIGKVIGKQGRTARSLRTILSAASMKYQQRFALDIVETDEDEDEDEAE